MEGGEVRCLTFEHAADRTPGMVERLDRWEARHPLTAGQKSRRRVSWRQPGGPYTFHADLGTVEHVLRGRDLTIVAADGRAPPALPEAFLRAPMHRSIETALPGVRWPAELDARTLRFGVSGPVCARSGDAAAVCAARYGSKYEGSGQDRTAAVFLSTDGGATFAELPWSQRTVPRGQSCWPPETIWRARFDEGRLVLRWEDPWIDWEPGYEWEGVWDPQHRTWEVRSVGQGW